MAKNSKNKIYRTTSVLTLTEGKKIITHVEMYAPTWNSAVMSVAKYIYKLHGHYRFAKIYNVTNGSMYEYENKPCQVVSYSSLTTLGRN